MIKWNYNEDQSTLSVEAEGVTLTFYMTEEGRVHYITDGDSDHYPNDNAARALHVKISGMFFSFYQLVLQAEKDIDAIKEELEESDRHEAQHIKEISSPFLTGRI